MIRHYHKLVQQILSLTTILVENFKNNSAQRVDCNKLRLPYVEEVTKNVRALAKMFLVSACREGIPICSS